MPQIILLDLSCQKWSDSSPESRARVRNNKISSRGHSTTSNEDQDRIRGYDLGANSFVRKPVEFEKIH